MKFTKQMTAFLLALLLVLSPLAGVPFATVAFAAGEAQGITTVSTGKAQPGETVTVTVSINQTVSTRGIALDFSTLCDWELFELVNANYTSAFSGKCLMAVPNLTKMQAASSAMSAFDWSGDVFTITLKVKENAAFGSYDLCVETVTVIDANKVKTNVETVGAALEIYHDCVLANEYSTDAESHWKACTVAGCNTAPKKEAHVFDNACDTDCNVCGYLRTITHDYSVQDKDAENHWMKCSVCGAVDSASATAHVFDNACDTDCNACGWTRLIEHSYANACDADCNVCGYIRVPADHVYDNACDADCNVCGAVREIKHSYDNLADADCNVCGAVRVLPTYIYAVHRGDTVTVSVAIANGATIRSRGFGLDLKDAYDPDAFELVSGEWSEAIQNAAMLASVRIEEKAAAFAATSEFDITGEIFTFTLKVKDNAAFGDYDANVSLANCDAVITTAAITVHECSPAEALEQDGENHWYACTTYGCTEQLNKAPHAYDHACDTDCNECGALRAITHDYSVQDKDAENHWMKCSVCGAIDKASVAAHAYDHACDTDCNACGAVREIQHDYSVQDKDAENHWMKCSVCGEIDKASVAPHAYDNACDPECNACGAVREIQHDYSVQDKDAENHWMKCSVCGEIDKASVAAHAYDNACDPECNACGAVREIQHDYTVQDKDAENHWMKCSVCGEIDKATVVPHAYDHACDPECNACGAVREIKHDYSVQDKDDKNHWMKCSVCGEIDKASVAPHAYDNACDPDCNACGAVREIQHDYSVQDKDAENHWMKCSVCGEIDQATVAAHAYDSVCDADCNVCGAVRTAPHDFTVQDKDDKNHWMKCSLCGVADETTVAAHVHDNACDDACNVCGQTRQVPDHVYDDHNDLTCNECGYERPPYVVGDVDGSGVVDMDDAIYLLFYCSFPDEYPVSQPLNFDNIGEVDMDDAIYLLFFCSFPDEYPLFPEAAAEA